MDVILQPLVDILGIGHMSRLLKLSPALVTEGVDALKLPLADRAKISVALAELEESAPKSANELKEYFVLQEDKKRKFRTYAYLSVKEKYDEILNSFSEAYVAVNAEEKLRDTFMRKCKNHTLTPFEVLIGYWCLYHKDHKSSCFFLASLICHRRDERVGIHNWHAVRDEPTHWLNSYGDAVAGLQLPLFPNVEEAKELNEILLTTKIEKGLDGGATGPTGDPHHGAPREVSHLYKKDAHNLWGGGALPVLDASGTQVGLCDTTLLEEYLMSLCNNRFVEGDQVRMSEMRHMLDLLNRTKNELHARINSISEVRQQAGRGRGRGARDFTSNQAQQQPPPQQQAHQQFRPASYGRSRGRGFWQGGGRDDAADDSPKNESLPGRPQ